MTHTRADYDSPWKEIIEHFFPEFMAFFFPQAFPEIDWSRPHEFLDRELQQLVREAGTGRRMVKGLYARGYSRSQIVELFRFIDWIMVLPASLEDDMRNTIQE